MTGDDSYKKVRKIIFLITYCLIVIFFVALIKQSETENKVTNFFLSSLNNNFFQKENLITVKENPYESLPIVLIEKDSVVGISAPVIISPQVLGAYSGYGPTDIISDDQEVIEYFVQEGETVSSLAGKFNISEETIIWANDIKNLQVGQKLTILPVSGAFHLVRKNDTLGEIALWYKADISEITEFNNISSANQIIAGDLLIIPNGVKPSVLPSPKAVSVPGTNFIYPVPGPIRITQGLHHYNAIDFGAPCGTPVYASESGTIQRTGYTGLGGNYVRILHANGIVTYYGHLQSSNFVRPGQQVSKGQVIGHVGLTGYTTGCHVHFEYRSPTGARNPFAR